MRVGPGRCFGNPFLVHVRLALRGLPDRSEQRPLGRLATAVITDCKALVAVKALAACRWTTCMVQLRDSARLETCRQDCVFQEPLVISSVGPGVVTLIICCDQAPRFLWADAKLVPITSAEPRTRVVSATRSAAGLRLLALRRFEGKVERPRPSVRLRQRTRTKVRGAKNAVTASQPCRHWTYV
jgi:hypothetical protein